MKGAEDGEEKAAALLKYIYAGDCKLNANAPKAWN